MTNCYSIKMELRRIPALVYTLIIVTLLQNACRAGAQRVTLAVQLETMQSQISQLRSDVDTLITHVTELRGGAGLVTVPTPTVEYDPSEFIFAHCRLMPNAGIERSLYEPIVGDIDLRQKATGGPVDIKLNLYGFQTPNSLHGMHVHAYGDLRNGCGSTGGHYKPRGNDHGGPHDAIRHIGDFGNIQADETGSIRTEMTDNVVTMTGKYSVMGRTMLIHGGADDLGKEDDDGSRRSGNAGVQLGCCVIGLADGSAWQ